MDENTNITQLLFIFGILETSGSDIISLFHRWSKLFRTTVLKILILNSTRYFITIPQESIVRPVLTVYYTNL